MSTQPTGRDHDHARDAERPWFVQVESTLINGEDDVMSPEPGEIVWAANRDDAGDRIRPRGYDTNLVAVRPATQAEVAAAERERVLDPFEDLRLALNSDPDYRMSRGALSRRLYAVIATARSAS